MKLAPKLQPFWFTPAFQDEQPPVRFKLRPLTLQQMVEVEELYAPSKDPMRIAPTWTDSAKFRAGMLSITACEGIVDDKGGAVHWPRGVEHATSPALRALIMQCGLRMIMEMNGEDWDAFVQRVSDAHEADKARVEQPAEGDAVKT